MIVSSGFYQRYNADFCEDISEPVAMPLLLIMSLKGKTNDKKIIHVCRTAPALTGWMQSTNFCQ